MQFSGGGVVKKKKKDLWVISMLFPFWSVFMHLTESWIILNPANQCWIEFNTLFLFSYYLFILFIYFFSLWFLK